MTYAELIQQIQDWCETAEATFVAEMPQFIEQAEKKIYRAIDLNSGRKESTVAMVSGTATLDVPSGLVAIHSITLVSSNARTLLIQKDMSYIDDYTGNRVTTGTPKYYGWYDEDTILLGPTPDSTDNLIFSHTYRPTQLSGSQTTTWLSLNAPDVMFYACMIEAATFLKLEPDTMQDLATRYQQAIQSLMMEENYRNRGDSYRDGEIKVNL